MDALSAYLFVIHGSRDPHPQIAVQKLAHLVRQQIEIREKFPKSVFSTQLDTGILTRSSTTAVICQENLPPIATAALELASIPLHQSIEEFAQKVQKMGIQRIKILPLFLLAGVHVQEDIPREIALAQEKLGKQVEIELIPYLGSYSSMKTLLAAKFEQMPGQGRILLSHGSRRPHGNQPVEKLASELEAIAAYWSVSPSLETQIATFVATGKEEISIVPYFLFSGGIIEAIAKQIHHLQYTFAKVKLILGEPLGTSTELANLIMEGIYQ